MEQRLGMFKGDTDVRSHQVLAGHHVGNSEIGIGDETQIAIGDDTDQLAVMKNRQTGNLVATHDVLDFSYRLVLVDGDRIGDHSRFRFLDPFNLLRLAFNPHILVNNADTALAGHGNRRRRLGNRIHCRADQWTVELDPRGQSGRQGDFVGQYRGGRRHEQKIIES